MGSVGLLTVYQYIFLVASTAMKIGVYVWWGSDAGGYPLS